MANDEVKDEQEDDVEDAALVDENEPIYYKPKTLSMISLICSWLAWVVIALVVLVIVAQVQYIMGIASQNSTTIAALLTDPQQGEQARLFIYSNILLPLLTGISFFFLLQAAAVGLNALLEIDFNIREPKK